MQGRRLEAMRLGPPPDEAPTIVFLHEGLGSCSTWRELPATLAAATGCGAFVYSRAGYGASDPVPLPRSLSYHEDEARLLPHVLDAAGVRHAVLFGHSDGASIALLHAGTGDPRLCALVLEAPHVFVEACGVEAIARIAEDYRSTDLRERLARHHGANVDVAFGGWSGAWLDPRFRSWNIERCLPGIRAPMLIFQGDSDPYGTVRQVDAIARGSGASVARRILAGCRHAPHRDCEAEVVSESARFVRAVLAGGRETQAV